MSPAHYEMLQLRKDRIDRRRQIDWQYWPDTHTQPHFAAQTVEADDKSRPDVEEDALITWGLAQRNGTKGLDTRIDVLYGEGAHLSRWYTNVEILRG
jgi:hypothetical protein